MNPLKLFFDPRTKRHYYISDDKDLCNYCNKEILKVIIFRFNWDRKDSKFEKSCLECLNKDKSIAEVKESHIAMIVIKPPKSSYPIFIKSPNLQSMRLDVSTFEAADLSFRKEDQPIVNNSKLINSNRQLPELHTYQIEDSKFSNEELEEVNKIQKKLNDEKRITIEERDLMAQVKLKENLKEDAVEDIDNFMDDMLSAKPVLPEGEKKLLEGKEKVRFPKPFLPK